MISQTGYGLPYRARVVWDQIVPGLEQIPTDIVPDTDASYDLGSSTNRFVELHLSSFAAIGTTPADAGILRLPNEQRINWRNAADAGNVGVRYDQNNLFTIEQGVSFAAQNGLTASTTQSQGQGAISSALNHITTVANANDVVTMPPAVRGRMCGIRNDGANLLQIFPASGDDIDDGATDASVTLAVNKAVLYYALDDTSWYTFGSG